MLSAALKEPIADRFELERALGGQPVQAAQQLSRHCRCTGRSHNLPEQRIGGNRRLDDGIERTCRRMRGLCESNQRKGWQGARLRTVGPGIQINEAYGL